MALTPSEIETFVRDGVVHLPGAVPQEVALACRDELWRASGCEPDDPATWTEPVVRIPSMSTPPFVAAARAQPLEEAYDQLVGPGGWRPTAGLGTFPLRFPSPEDPGDTGWHVEASFAGDDGQMRVSLRSRGRALLALFLFSEVGEQDAPTRVRLGSHLDVPTLLRDTDDAGLEWLTLCGQAVPASAGRPVELVTGSPGDVYLCHPFLVHGAQPHHGSRPRFMAQPPVVPTGELDLQATEPTPVARAVLAGLGRARRAGGSPPGPTRGAVSSRRPSA